MTNPEPPTSSDGAPSEPLYYANGLDVHKRAIRRFDGRLTSITLGFRVCTVSDTLGEDGAATLAEMLSAAETGDGASSASTKAGSGTNNTVEAGEQSGWRWVPVEPTEAMLGSAYQFCVRHRGPSDANDAPGPFQTARDTYRAMLAASPSPGGAVMGTDTPPELPRQIRQIVEGQG